MTVIPAHYRGVLRVVQENLASGHSIVVNWTFWVATAIFVLTYVFILMERVHQTVVVLAGASLMLVLKILGQHEAFNVEELGVDWNVIFLLIAMMIIVNLLQPTGFFEYVAIRSAKLGGGHPLKIMIIFVITTSLLSAFLNNVTTVLIIVPVSLFIADACEVDVRVLLIVEAIASNIGGTATLTGDPPNMMIASKARLSFMDFIYNLTPIVVLLMAVIVLLIWL
ncbi:MAG: anion permease, partial [Nitrospirae bacterium]|nr:anion permease [Nitrospirota bacterium]